MCRLTLATHDASRLLWQDLQTFRNIKVYISLLSTWAPGIQNERQICHPNARPRSSEIFFYLSVQNGSDGLGRTIRHGRYVSRYVFTICLLTITITCNMPWLHHIEWIYPRWSSLLEIGGNRSIPRQSRRPRGEFACVELNVFAWIRPAVQRILQAGRETNKSQLK